MKLAGKTAVVTGAASGLGKALARRFIDEGAKSVIVADVQADALSKVAQDIGALAVVCDVRNQHDIAQLVEKAEAYGGPIDVFVSNAGIARYGGEHSSDQDWQANWDIHVMAHVYAARQVAAKMAERGTGYLVNTSSAAGLLTHVNSATYSVTKHAAIAFAEFLAIQYGPKGVKVSVLCPQAVRTAMTKDHEDGVASVDGMMETDELCDCVIRTMDEEKFLILPHPQVLDYLQRKTNDYDRWLRGMQKLAAQYQSNDGDS